MYNQDFKKETIESSNNEYLESINVDLNYFIG